MAYRFYLRLTRSIGRRFLIEWALIGALGIGAAIASWSAGFPVRASFLIYDQLLSHAHKPNRTASKVVLVTIDDASIAELGRWPWSRAIHAALLTQLSKAKPRAVVYDVLFTEASAQDAEFARAMRLTPTYLPILVDHQPVNLGGDVAIMPVPVLANAAAGVGHIDLEVDRDGIVRRLSLMQGNAASGTWWPSLMVSVYRALKGADAPLPGESENMASTAANHGQRRAHRMLIPFSPASLDYPTVSFAQVLKGEVPPEFFRDKVVLVGSTAAALHDGFATPISGQAGEIPGVNIHATILDALLENRAIEPVDTSIAAWIILVPIVILLAGLLIVSPLQSLLLTLALGSVSLVSSAGLLYLQDLWLSPVPALSGLALIYLLWSWRRLEVAMSYLGQELRLLAAEPYLLSAYEADSANPANTAGDLLERLIALTKQAVQRQRNMRQFIWDSLNSLPEPIIICNLDGQILLTNDPARAYFGADRFGGTTLMQLFSEFHFVRIVDAEGSTSLPHGLQWPSLLDPRRRQHVEVLRRGIEVRDQRGHDHMLRYAPCTASTGGVVAWVASCVDITALHAAERQRDGMLHLLSHDMRSPQASILALLETEKSTVASQHVGALMSRVERYARRTLALADDIVQLARAESHDYSFELVNFHDLALDACDEIWPLARAKNIEIRCNSEGSHFWVLADRSRLTRALINLLSNAVKFSPPATEIDCRVIQTPATILCLVSDQGYGIALEQQAHLFERFKRFHTPGQPASDGTGLGMAFVKTVVSRHRGDILVESAPQRGTTVTIILPVNHVGETQP